MFLIIWLGHSILMQYNVANLKNINQSYECLAIFDEILTEMKDYIM